MLAIKKTRISKNKIIGYTAAVILIIALTIFQLSSGLFSGKDSGSAESSESAGQTTAPGAVQSGDIFSKIATSTPAQLNIYEIGLYDSIVENPKYKSLREAYLDDPKEIKKGKENPFIP